MTSGTDVNPEPIVSPRPLIVQNPSRLFASLSSTSSPRLLLGQHDWRICSDISMSYRSDLVAKCSRVVLHTNHWRCITALACKATDSSPGIFLLFQHFCGLLSPTGSHEDPLLSRPRCLRYALGLDRLRIDTAARCMQPTGFASKARPGQRHLG